MFFVPWLFTLLDRNRPEKTTRNGTGAEEIAKSRAKGHTFEWIPKRTGSTMGKNGRIVGEHRGRISDRSVWL